MTRTRVLAALLAGLTLAGVGTAATALGSDDPAATPPVSVVAQTSAAASTSTSTSTPAAAAAITPDEAGSRALTHLGGGTVTQVERETEHGRTVWEVDVRRDTRTTEVHVDTATGTVTRVEDDSRDDRDREDRGREDRGRHGGDDRRDGRGDDHGGRHGGDDGPGHDLFDDKGGDR